MKYPNVLGKDFNTKSEAYKHLTSLRDQMVNAGKLGESNYLTEDTAVKKSWIDSLFKDYFKCDDPDWYRRKIGLGVKDWFFGRDSEDGICLNIKQKNSPQDPTKSDFFKSIDVSHWGKHVPVSARYMFTCFGPGVKKEENPLRRVKEALRKTVKYQVKEFRESVRDECQECGEEGYGLELEVDHHNPDQKEIAANFIKKYGEKVLVESVSKLPTQDIWTFKNKEIEADWCEYHLKEANLRLLCVPCHDKKTYKRNDSL